MSVEECQWTSILSGIHFLIIAYITTNSKLKITGNVYV